jgi:hypothetical protein
VAIHHPSPAKSILTHVATILAACAATGLAMYGGFRLGTQNQPTAAGVFPLIYGATAASSDSMAAATGRISEDSEGIFFLDFNTGDLQCMVYYPRMGGMGAHYYANVLPALGGGGKNAKYLLVTGDMNTTVATGNTRPGGSLVYVTDVNSGMFAAYAVPWNRSQESAGRPQSGQLVLVASGAVRNYRLPGANAAPAAIVDPNKK